MKRFCIAIALAGAFSISAASAAPSSFFEDLSGNWSGSGKAYVTKFGEVSAKCRLSVSGADTKVADEGQLRYAGFSPGVGPYARKYRGEPELPAPTPDQKPVPQNLKESSRTTDWF